MSPHKLRLRQHRNLSRSYRRVRPLRFVARSRHSRTGSPRSMRYTRGGLPRSRPLPFMRACTVRRSGASGMHTRRYVPVYTILGRGMRQLRRY